LRKLRVPGDPRDTLREAGALVWIIGAQQPDLLSEPIDRVGGVLLAGVERTEDPSLSDDVRRLAPQLRRHRGRWGVRVIQLLDQPGHPAAAALEESDAQARELVEDAASDQCGHG